MDCFGRASNAGEETKKKAAEEKMNLKITTAQIKSYTETQTMPTLQYLADELCEDDDMEYVTLKEKEQASLEKITVGKTDSILTKLKEYPYEFEIDNELKLASINGIKLANTEVPDGYVKQSDYNALLKRVEKLEENVTNLESRQTSVLYDNGKITTASETTTYTLNDSIENYTFILIESIGGADPNTWRCSDIFSVKEIVNSDEYHATIDKYSDRWCRIVFDGNKFYVKGMNAQYPIRILGIKI